MTVKKGPTVYFIGGCQAGTTFEYRVLHKQEQLQSQGVQSTAQKKLSFDDDTLEEALSHDVLFLYRVGYTPFIEALIEQARARSIPVVFGTDDLVFEPEMVHWVDPLKTMTLEEVAHYYEGVWRYRQTLMASDYIVTSTEYLAQLARHHGKKVFVHRNAVSQQMIDVATALIAQRSETPTRDTVIIGYSSGTDTHRKDVAEIGAALAEVMERYTNVELLVLGPVSLPDNLTRFQDRIRRTPLVPWEEVPPILNTFDINLAPLESGSPFCRGKSEVKYTEAALFEIPTVASRIDAFEFAIREGETGFLAATTDEWVAALERLVTDAALRRRIGKAARADVLARYTPDVRGKELVQTLETIQRDYAQRHSLEAHPRLQLEKRPLILNWLIREPIPGSGGYTNIVRMMNHLAGFGHRINIYVTPNKDLIARSDVEIREFIRTHFAELNGSLFKWNDGPLAESDAVVLTHWTTTNRLKKTRRTPKVFYFVQDWEPFFSPMGMDYLGAEQTYKMGFTCITLGQWLSDSLREWYGADTDYFDFAVDHDIYYPRPVEKARHQSICFYARPSTPRRLFPLGAEALALVHERRPDVEIVLYGAEDKHLPQDKLTFPYTNLGILNEHQLAELFSSSDVGLVFSSTNCSLVPPEMMACKCAVVDLNRDTVRGVLEQEVNALLADPTPEAVAEAVLRLLEDEALRVRLVKTAYEHVQNLSWEKSARRVEEILYQKLSPARPMLGQHPRDVQPNLASWVDFHPQHRWHLDTIHNQRRRLGTRWRARIKGWVKRLLQIDHGRVLNDAPVHTLGELTGRRRIGQTIVAQRANLFRIDVLLATYGRRNTRDVIFRLKDSPKTPEDLAVVCLNASSLDDNAYAHFIFEPRPTARSYYFSIESPDSIPGDAITSWAYSDVDLPGVRLKTGRRAGKGQLIFGLYYLDDQWGQVGERPLLREWGYRTTHWDRLKMSYRLLRSGNPRQLWREVVNYWKWKTGAY